MKRTRWEEIHRRNVKVDIYKNRIAWTAGCGKQPKTR